MHKRKIPIEFGDLLEVYYGGDVYHARLASKDMLFHNEVEVVIENEIRDFIKVTDIMAINGKDVDYQFIAKINGISEGTYKSRLNLGWNKLRAATEKVSDFRLQNEKGA